MVKAHHKGPRSKTRYAYKKNIRQKGKPTVNKMLKTFEIGDMAHINVDPSIHAGMPFRRFQGKTGKILEKRGSSYIVEVKNIRAIRKIIVHPIHLSKQQFTTADKAAQKVNLK